MANPIVAVVNGKVKLMPLASLREFPGNARQGDVDTLCHVIERVGFHGFVLVNMAKGGRYGDGTVLVGNHRLLAAQKLGMAKVPCNLIEVDDQRALELNLSDNKVSDEATYDDRKRLGQLRELLGEDLKALASDDDVMLGVGYDLEDLEFIRSVVEDEQKPRGGGMETRAILIQAECPNCGHGWAARVNGESGLTQVKRGSGRGGSEGEE